MNLHSSGHAAARGEQRLPQLAGCLADDHRTRRLVAAHHRSEEWRTVDSRRSSDLHDPPSDGRRVLGASGVTVLDVVLVLSPQASGYSRTAVLVLLRVPQHEAQMSAVHRGDGGTP